jgi:hypothetical protein
MTDPIRKYRNRVLAAYPTEFAIWTDVAGTLEHAVQVPRNHPTLVHLVLDMFMIQGLKSHGTVALLAQHGLMEDAATIARRLLELSVQAVYIGAESDERVRVRRAGMYLAFLWRQLTPVFKRRLPPGVRKDWTAWARRYGRYIRRRARRWGPDFREMFTQVGSEELYLTDYAFLSSMAHGAADSQVFQYSVERIRIHRHDFVPVVLIYSSRYYLAIAEQWNRAYSLLPDGEFARLTSGVVKWRRKKGAA